MKIAVTGTSGRVGRAIHFHLCQENDVVGLDRTPASATSHIGEITDVDLLGRLFEGVDAVIHVAALHAPQVGLTSDIEFHRINVEGTATVAQTARECGVGKLVYTSTTALYGKASKSNDEAVWIDEATQPEPHTIYHQTKLEAEGVLSSLAGSKFNVVVLRMSRCFPEPVPTMAIYRLHRGVDARDVARGHELAIKVRGPSFQRFILSGATPFDRSDCAALKSDCEGVLRQKSPALCSEFDARGWCLPESIDRVYDSSSAQRDLGWLPLFGAENVVRLFDEGHSEVLPPQAAGSSVSE